MSLKIRLVFSLATLLWISFRKVLHVPFKNTVVPETVANAIVAANSSSHDYILGASTKFGSTIIPRVAACLKPDIASPITDIVEIIDANTFIRPIYAGNALAKVKSKPGISTKVLTIRPTSFEKSPLVDAASVEVETLNVLEFESSMFVGEAVSGGGASDRADLGSASIVVSGGRGLKNGENFDMLGKLIDKIAAPGTGAIGASRAAVDAGFVPNDWQVGQTGKVVAPDLYIAIGISGAIQHLSGMKDSKVVVAINKDPEAPIFQVADYGLVSDLFTVVPEMTKKTVKIKRRKRIK